MRNTLIDDTAARVSLVTALRTDGTVNGTTVDTVGTANFFRSTTLVVLGGTITDGTHTVKLQDSADDSNWDDVAAEYLKGTLVDAADDSVQLQSYIGHRRYLRAVVTTASATTGGITSALILLSSPSGGAPVS